METVIQDLRHAARRLRRSPGFAAVSVFTLALAIGATTAIFSVVYGVLLRPLPYNDPHRLTAIFEVNTRGTWSRLADPNFDDFRDQNHSFEVIAKYSADPASVSGTANPPVPLSPASPLIFSKCFACNPPSGGASMLRIPQKVRLQSRLSATATGNSSSDLPWIFRSCT